MSVLGFHFNYKKAFILSLVCSQSVWCFSLLMFGITQLNFGFYDGTFKLSEILGYYVTCIVHDSITASPLVSFILLVGNLRKRFVTLNDHLRYNFNHFLSLVPLNSSFTIKSGIKRSFNFLNSETNFLMKTIESNKQLEFTKRIRLTQSNLLVIGIVR